MLIAQQVAPNATPCQAGVAFRINDRPALTGHTLRMGRMHYIPEWAKQAGKAQAALVRETGVDKSNVSRWFRGVIPDREHLIAVAEALGAPEPAALFVHPAEYKILQEIRALNQRANPAA